MSTEIWDQPTLLVTKVPMLVSGVGLIHLNMQCGHT